MGSSSSSNYPFKEYLSLLTKLSSYLLCAILPIILIHFYYKPFYYYSQTYNQLPSTNRVIISSSSSSSYPPPFSSSLSSSSSSQEVLPQKSVLQTCDYGKGEWVPNNSPPLYNGTTCDTIKHGQNCMLFGRPDKLYLHWKWQPKQCKLPKFDPKTFLKLLENKHIAFVGDSLARNQLESLLCMTATASKPELLYTNGEDNKFRKWNFPSHNVTISVYWSPFLVKGVEKTNEQNFNTLFLDFVDERWGRDLDNIDTIVFSIGHWYLHPAIYYYRDAVVGCHYVCKNANHTETGFYDVYGRALKIAFESVIQRKGPFGPRINVFLTTFPPAHFEGEWDKLGACSKTKPYKESETILKEMNAEMRRVGVGKVREAKMRADEYGNSVRIEALDISELALLRPDGHPGPYMNPFPFANGVSERVQNDCVHWCLPGAIDTWNEILLDVIRRWDG